MMRLMSMAVATAALGLGLALSPAQAATIGFVGINADQENLSGQLSVDVTQPGGVGGDISFAFTNAVGIPSNISEIYFDWVGNLFSGIVSIVGTSGVNFVEGGSPANLPEGQNLTPPFNADTLASAINPAPKNGINDALDMLTIVLDLTDPNGLITSLIGNLRVGLHVTGIGAQGGSDSYVSNPITPGTFANPVPLPAGIWLLGTALVGLGLLGRRRRQTPMMAA